MKTYIAQEEIHSAEYEGTRFDFRILAHANQEEYILTGVGVRLSQKQDVTTHIPSGGRLIPYRQFQSNDHDEFFRLLFQRSVMQLQVTLDTLVSFQLMQG